MPRKPGTSGGPTCAWVKKSGSRCKMPVSIEGHWCHKHQSLVPPEEAKRMRIEQSKRNAIADERRFSRNEFARRALVYGLDAPETKEAYEKMVVANGEDPPVPASWGKP